MSLKSALETAKEILEGNVELNEADYTDHVKLTAMKKSKKDAGEDAAARRLSSGGEDPDVEMTPGMKGSAVSADGTTPKVAEPVAKGQMNRMGDEEEMMDDEEEMMDDEEEMMDDEEEMMDDDEEEYGEEEMSMPTEKGDTPSAEKKKRMMKTSMEGFTSLMSGEGLSEEFQDKATLVFEAAVDMKVDELRTSLHEEFETALEEHKETLATKLDEYLSYVVENWMQENQVAIDSGIRSDISESFMVGLKKLFEQHYVTMPEESYDLVEGLNNKIDSLEEKLNESVEKNVELAQGLVKAQCEAIYEASTSDLTQADENKFRSIVEKVDFSNAEEFQAKLSELKESFFDTADEASVVPPLVEEFAESEDSLQESINLTPSMEAYSKALSRSASSDNNRSYKD